MNMKLCFLFFFTCLIQFSTQDGEKKIRHMVVEMSLPLTTEQCISRQVDYITLASLAFRTDLIVLPEGALTLDEESATAVPDPKDQIIPYKDDTSSYLMKTISKSAADGKIYVVVNVFERVNCTKGEEDCPQKGYFLYNTNVAFDRKGAVIARYRKINVDNEGNVDRPKTPELSTFTTDYGFTYGMLTSIDILFKTPALDLINQKQIRNFIFPSRWYGEYPFLTAAQVQAGWSFANNVTLLASGLNKPQIGSSGTGIYDGREFQDSDMFEREGTMMMYIDLKGRQAESFKPASERYQSLKLSEDPSVPSAEKRTLSLKGGNFKEKVCHNGICCTFDLTFGKSYKDNKYNYTYSVLAFDGERPFGKNFAHDVAYCAVVLCRDGNCAKRASDDQFPLVFEQIKIEAEFESKESLTMPSTLLAYTHEERRSFFNTMEYKDFSFESKKMEGSDKNYAKIELVRENAGHISTFGIFVKKFDRN